MAEHSETPADDEEEKVWSWGAGTDGQLGTGRLEDDLLPQLLSLTSLSSISMLACGGAHVIALTSGGKVLTWGRGNSGQLGHGDILNTSLPKPVSFFENYVITQAAAGWSHSGFVSDSGCLFTCGNGSFGQLGHGDNMSLTSPAKVSYFLNKSVKMVACGMRHSLVLFAGNQVCGFGSGKRGQLGFSLERTKSVNLPCVVSGLQDVEVISISANGDHSAAISADGQLFSWGRGFCGHPDIQTPQCLPSSLSFREVTLGWNHALLLTVDGEVFKLGNTLDKQSEKQEPQVDSCEALLEKVPDFDQVKVVQIAAGAEHSVAVTENGEVKTWGWGEHGQLGLGNTNDQANPQLVSLGSIDLPTKVYCGSGFTYADQTNNAVDPRSLMFKKNMYGKPEVDWQNCSDCNNPPLHFNISHTDSLNACGVTVHVPVGIDVEDKERKIKHDVLALAGRFYSADEVNFLATITDPEVQRKEFIKLWTLKEAYVKALGKGFSAAPFNTFTIQSKAGTKGGYNLCKTSEMKVDSMEGRKKCGGGWKFSLLELAGSHFAAICIQDDPASGGTPMRVIVRKTIPYVEDELISESELL